MLYSFDVFDTLISRTTANPRGIFALMKDTLCKERVKNGLEDYVIDNFFELRIHSEELARKASSFQNREEVSLYDIYKAMSVCGCLNDEKIKYLYELEEKTELSNVIGISENIKRLKKLLEGGDRVILISDMYLSRNTIRRMLLQVDEVFREIPLYVSSEYGVRKTTGNLYRKVQELEQVGYEEWIHIGDNIHQDIEVPYWIGINAELFQRLELTEFENKILQVYEDDSRLQILIGSAQRSVENNAVDANDREITRALYIGCRYAGPVLYSYAEWIVDQAIKKKTKRLYFIARDGYLIKKIVDIILQSRNSDIITKYIYGSRKAWRMSSLSENHYNLYQLILWSHALRITTLKELASVLHIPLQELYDFLPGIYARNRCNARISNQELEYIAGKLSRDEEFRAYHLQRLANERKLVQQYLEQEIDVSDDAFAFVDVSGGGLTQGCLLQLLKNIYSKPIHTFFFKIDRVNLVKNSVTDTFMPGFLENNLTIEMMCRAPHGQTKGYLRRGANIVPELEDTESQTLEAYKFFEYEKGIIDFARLMCETSEACGINVGSMHNVLLYLRHIAHEPSRDVLEYFAAMPSSESGRGEEAMEYAPKLTVQEIKEIFLRRTNEPVEFFYKGTDLNYSVMRATEEERALIERCKREHDSALGKLYRQDRERERNQRDLVSRYGRAAFYPVRLLDEKVILYGAGNFGQDLYNRLKVDQEHEVVLWVDKNAYDCRQKGLSQVCDISKIDIESDIQIVIAVMAETTADEIRIILEQMGICKKRIVWIRPYTYPVSFVEWKSEKIG